MLVGRLLKNHLKINDQGNKLFYLICFISYRMFHNFPILDEDVVDSRRTKIKVFELMKT